IVFLIVSSLAAFGRIAGNDFISLDDPGYITKNLNIQSGINPGSIQWAFTTSYFTYWHPVTWLSHMVDWRLWGTNPSGHHVVSLFLHISAVILLFLFLYKTTNHIWSSAFAAAFFALHPLRVESVAWASERKDVLSMLFGIASIYAYAFYAEKPQLSKYILCLVLFVLALMSKPVMVTLPFVLILLDYWPLGRWQTALNASRTIRLSLAYKLIREKIPFILLSIASSIITFRGQNAVEAVAPFPLALRTANAIESYLVYLGKIFWPVNLAVFYPYNFSLPLWKVVISGFILISMTILVIYYLKKTPFFFVGWFWYLGTFIPLIGLVQAGGHAITDRHTYLPSIGIAIVLARGFPFLVKNKKILFFGGMAVIIILAILTWRQCGYWKNGITLFSHTLMVTKNNDRIHANCGLTFFEKGKINQAVYHFNKAIRIAPYCHDYYMSRAHAYVKAGNYQKAIDDFNMTIRLKPDYAEAYYERGTLYGKFMGQYQSAIEDFNRAIHLNPNFIRAYNNRGIAYGELGQYQDAIDNYNKAIKLETHYADAYNNRANIYFKLEKIKSGCMDAKKACDLGICKSLDAAKNQGLCN
ncbi:MAG: tetratricopeptide repeat protein, partial [Syntrophaceae bacterium]|nr:tetratricopeptide repeat protein [Syntrophaceae bacterium]